MAALTLKSDQVQIQPGQSLSFSGAFDSAQFAFPQGSSLFFTIPDQFVLDYVEIDGRRIAAAEFSANDEAVRIPFTSAFYQGRHAFRILFRNLAVAQLDRLAAIWLTVIDAQDHPVLKGKTASQPIRHPLAEVIAQGITYKIARKCNDSSINTIYSSPLACWYPPGLYLYNLADAPITRGTAVGVGPSPLTMPDAYEPILPYALYVHYNSVARLGALPFNIAYTFLPPEAEMNLAGGIRAFPDSLSREFITAYYLYILGRNPTAAEMANYLPLFTQWRNPMIDLLDVYRRRGDLQSRFGVTAPLKDWDPDGGGTPPPTTPTPAIDYFALLQWVQTEGWRDPQDGGLLQSFKPQGGHDDAYGAFDALHNRRLADYCGPGNPSTCAPFNLGAIGAICSTTTVQSTQFGIDVYPLVSIPLSQCWSDPIRRNALILWAKDVGWYDDGSQNIRFVDVRHGVPFPRKVPNATLGPYFAPGRYPEYTQERPLRYPPATLYHELVNSPEYLTFLQGHFKENINSMYLFLLNREAGQADFDFIKPNLTKAYMNTTWNEPAVNQDWEINGWQAAMANTGKGVSCVTTSYAANPVCRLMPDWLYGIQNFQGEADLLSARVVSIQESLGTELGQGDNFKRMVSGLYRLYLRRAPSDAEVDSQRGQKFGKIEFDLNQSSEYASKPASTSAVASVYRNYLGRDPGLGEGAGQTIEHLVLAVGISAEMIQIAQDHPENAYIFPIQKIHIIHATFWDSTFGQVMAGLISQMPYGIGFVASASGITERSRPAWADRYQALWGHVVHFIQPGLNLNPERSLPGLGIMAVFLKSFQFVNGSVGFTGKIFYSNESLSRAIAGLSGGVNNLFNILESDDPIVLSGFRMTADAAYVASVVPGAMSAGSSPQGLAAAALSASALAEERSYMISITFKNTGKSVWDSDYALVLQSTASWSVARIPLQAGEKVPPGSQKTFVFYVRPPATSGNHLFQWRMQRGSQAIGKASPPITVKVDEQPRVAALEPVVSRVAADALQPSAGQVAVTLQGAGFVPGATILYNGPMSGSVAANVLDSRTLRFSLPQPLGQQTSASSQPQYSFAVQNPEGGQSRIQQVSLAAPETDANLGDLSFKEVYVYPNPSLRSRRPTFHIETTRAVDEIELKVYDVAGDLVDRKALSGMTGTPGAGGSSVYEYSWDASRLASGIYLYRVKVSRMGASIAARTGKLSIIK